MKTKIHRKEIRLGVVFKAPISITVGFQNERESFSVWFEEGRSDPQKEIQYDYVLIPTWDECPFVGRLKQTVIMPDGFTVYHLVISVE